MVWGVGGVAVGMGRGEEVMSVLLLLLCPVLSCLVLSCCAVWMEGKGEAVIIGNIGYIYTLLEGTLGTVLTSLLVPCPKGRSGYPSLTFWPCSVMPYKEINWFLVTVRT